MKTPIPLRSAAILMSALASVATATTFTVTDPGDTGLNFQLRWAITQANLDNDPVNPTVIDFQVPNALLTPPAPGGVAVIQPVFPLPVIQNQFGRGVHINGFTQPGSAFTPGDPRGTVVTVELDGSLMVVPYTPPPPLVFAHGLYIMSSNNIVEGLCVHSFPDDGISIQGIWQGTAGHPGSNTNQIRWNLVGTDVTGMVAMPNGLNPGGLWGGIYVKVLPGSPGIANQNIILENVASGNAIEGIGISNCPDEGSDVAQNHVERNLVGIDITGTNANPTVGNGHDGIYIGEGAHHNVIDQNWGAMNGYSGVGIVGYGPSNLSTHSNTLTSNRIGVDMALNLMGNLRHGVAIGSYGGTVWGFAPNNLLTNNTVAYNGLAGVAVDEEPTNLGDQDTSFNTITQNSIHHNGYVDPGYLGIDLAFEPTTPRPPGGVTDNESTPGDLDDGPNDLVNFPVITSALFNSGTTTASGTIDVNGGAATIEVFLAIPGNYSNHGQGATYLGSDPAPGATTWSAVLTGGLPGQLLTATTTDTLGNTSEFSANVPVWDENQQPDDYGDAPDTYLTLAASGGPVHAIKPGMYLGASVDGEPDGQPNANATGDDILDGNDDEDGVAFPTPLVPGQSAQIDITASAIGLIDAWIDFDGSGTFNPGSEQILANQNHPGGGLKISYSFNVPAGASPGITTVSRVRYSTAGNTLPTGPAGDGEVEDHEVTIDDGQGTELDWGDAPDQPYRTLMANGGPSHPIATDPTNGTTICLGNSIDSEGDGQQDPNALGDDNDGNDDEDGVVFNTPMNPGLSASVIVTASVSGFVDAWIDFDQSGTFGDQANELIYTGPVNAGANTLNFGVPAGSVTGTSFARFRYNTTAAGLSPVGQAYDGEVEDYKVTIDDETPQDLDFGDAPYNPPTFQYPTLLANNGARHVIVVGGPILGSAVDSEPDGQPSSFANGDDLFDGGDDEDGISFPNAIMAGVPTNIQVSTITGGTLQGWIDWNGDGDWADTGEQVATDVAIPVGGAILNISVPSWATGGTNGLTYARFRISSQAGLGFDGWAQDGEVEDHLLHLEPLKWLQIPEQGSEGVDVNLYVNDPESMLADDFECTGSGPITDIHLWGSFFDDVMPEEGPGGLTFEISIWSDVPVGADSPYSHPGVKLWEHTFLPGQYGADQIWEVVPIGEWWHDPGTANWDDDADNNIYQFDFYPPAGEAFVQEGNPQAPIVYWLAVRCRYDGTSDFQFGWKTTPEPWNDDACYFDPANPPVFWRDMIYQPPHPWSDPELEMTSVNLAFALSGGEDLDSDWGDAPDPGYPTLSASTGAAHSIDALFLGATVDTEPDGQPDPTATGDDLDAGGNDDDGVIFLTPLVAGRPADIQVIASAPGILDAWLDMDGDGTWSQPNEWIIPSIPVNPGDPPLRVTLPPSSMPRVTIARFRLSHGGAGVGGMASGGEVEDYQVAVGWAVQAQATKTLSPATLVLNWPTIGGTSYYSVHSSTTLATPVPIGWTLETPVPPGVTGTSWSETITVLKKFYVVVAWP